MKLSLPDVTLCAVTCINHELTLRAMKKSLEHCTFGDVVMISSLPMDAPFRVEIIPYFSGEYYGPFVCKELIKYTNTSHNLVVQYDSFIVEPAAWDKSFLDYDYIGPKWPWQPEGKRVGNSGFCLRSRKLLDITSKIPLPPVGEWVDDTLICHAMRDFLEKKHGIKIAPEDVADKFAYERHKPDQPTFGFHGMFNFWRHVDDDEMQEFISLLDPLYIQSRAYAEILFQYHAIRKFRILDAGYKRLLEQMDQSGIKSHLLNYIQDTVFVDELIRNAEVARRIYQAS